MAETNVKPPRQYGLWPSPITAELMATSNVSLHEVRVNERTGAIYWTEGRPQEQGRFVIMQRKSDGNIQEVLPNNHSARGMVQELGGGSFEIDADGQIIFSDKLNSNVYRLDPDSQTTTRILKAEPDTCYADFACHPAHYHCLVAIKEDRREATPETQADDVHNTLVVIDVRSGTERQIVGGDDFYAYPRFNPAGTRLCWVQWSHPDMPWTGTRLYVADWIDGDVKNIKQVAGEKLNESVSQSRWSSNGTLWFASDRSGYWQLHSYSGTAGAVKMHQFPGLEECEFAIADWLLASSTYAFLTDSIVVASCVSNGMSELVILDVDEGSYRRLASQYVDLAMSSTGIFRVTDDSFAILGSTQKAPKHLALVSDARSLSPTVTVIKPPTAVQLSSDFISEASHLQIPRKTRPGNVHAYFFPPQHADAQAPSDAPPPVLVYVHGGPNGCTSPAFDLSIQYWTTRGFAVCSVNYVGSVGHGRAYREALTGHWGLHDIEDTHDVVEYLKSSGRVDGSRVGIYGGSAGGYVTLSAIHMFPSSFAAAVSSYGIADIRALQADTYKFESHDVERLALSGVDKGDKEARERLFWERSPRYHAGKIEAPLLLLQGTVDKAVPPEQAQMMAKEMRENGRTCKVVEFEGEAHGWVRSDTILRAYREQEAWWKMHLCGLSKDEVMAGLQ